MSSDNDSMAKLLGLSVKPLKQDKVAPFRKPVSAIPKQRLLDDQRALQELLDISDESTNYERGDEVKFLRAGHSNRLIKKLRRGDFEIEDQLDLHGLTAEQAKLYTHGFINECAQDGLRAVRIVHGKGRNSEGHIPVIKNMLIGWLSKNQNVTCVTSASLRDGGTGAVYVLLVKS